MAYSVRKLITNAYYLSGVVARNQQTVTGQQVSDGLDLLNDILGIKTANTRLIPYYSQYSLTAVVGQETYFIPNLIESETVTFNQQTVRYSMLKQGRKKYFGSARVDNISALPFNWHLERTKGGANLYLYYLPVQPYVINIMGKFGLTSVTLSTDLEQAYDRFYIVYLRYALAEYICAETAISVPPQTQAKLNEIEELITDISPMDLSVTKLSAFNGDSGLNWANINIGRGWTVS